VDEFNSIRPDNFTYAGLKALYEYFEELEEDCGNEIELDVIAFCVEYTEYTSIEEFHQNYDREDYPDMESIESYTQVIPIDDESFIIQDF
jgi:hypothetical protein